MPNPGPPQAGDDRPAAPPDGTPASIVPTLGRLGPWIALASLALWTSTPSRVVLAVAFAGLVLALWRPRAGGWWSLSGVGVLVAGLLMAWAAHRETSRVLDDFESYWADRDTVVGEMLGQRLDRMLTAAIDATDVLAEMWIANRAAPAPSVMRNLLSRCECSAVALYDPEGDVVVWEGEHRGLVPDSVQSGLQEHSYQDLALFGYLYVTRVADDGSVAMAAHLLRSALPESLGADVGDFATSFFRETGERIRVTKDDPGDDTEGIVFDLQGEERILSVVVDRPDPVLRAEQLMDGWVARVAVLLLVAWAALAIGARARTEGRVSAAIALLLLAAWVPLERAAGLSALFDTTAYTLPGPLSLSIGRLALLAISAFTLMSVLPRPRFTWPAWVAGLAVALAFPALLLWAPQGASPELVAEGRLGWVTYQVAVAALLSLLAGAAIAKAVTRRITGWAAFAAVVLALALGACAWAWVWSTSAVPSVWTALWGLPAILAASGARAWTGWRGSFARWTLAVVLGGTAAIPVAWSHRVQARMLVGETELADLASPDAPELERALLRFGELADSLHNTGSDDLSLLYHGWRLSGLADLGDPVWLQVWGRDGSPREGLRMGVRGEPAPLREALIDAWLTGGMRLLRPYRDDARYILTRRLANDEVVSVVAPPFVEGSPTGLGPLLEGATSGADDPLTVIPLAPGERHDAEDLMWVRTADGWQAEIALAFDNDATYHAHYRVTLPPPGIALARATLLLALNLVLFMGFWMVGQSLVGGFSPREIRLAGLMLSFRARVTLALFGFFTIANALFGTIAYRTLVQTSRRSTQVIAERVAEDAASWYIALGGQMDRLASQVGAELLHFRNAELAEGSAEELVSLGLHEAWAPYGAYTRLAAGEDVLAVTETALGRWAYVTAYRRLSDEDVVAARVPLAAGTTALQTTDLLELLGFVMLVGALLSGALAMLAGRWLTRPILALQIASERVGSGDLVPKLPADRTDEFGPVFRAFNDMVERVRRARRQLVRTSRRTQLIMDEAAVGMVALDSAGRVTLVNPRAGDLLAGGEAGEGAVVVGRELPADTPLGAALVAWLDDFLRGTAEEADTELQAEHRRVRVRARRLGTVPEDDGRAAGGSGRSRRDRGVVVAMDDVTDELRAERVLAWGEMARQVAHEVKNPLTPIKLSIQHVRRAFEDRHPQFEQILMKNAEAMLSEIDRLAGIAQSFSRFGAPGGPAVALAPVFVADVVSEVMALYGSSVSRVRFEQDVAPGLPPVISRTPELKEVLVNLLENARLADGTVVRIVARRGDDADTVHVAVVDNGSGIPEDVLPRIFEPQFSTRSTGTGLGLAIVQRLVRSWGGSVSVASEVERGTTVTVTLPVWTSEPE